jgi:alpha-L-fucosidase
MVHSSNFGGMEPTEEGPSGKKQEYDFRRFEQTMRKLAPNTIVFSDIGPEYQVGRNEKGIAGKTNWNLLDTAVFKRGQGAPPTDTPQRRKCERQTLSTGRV